jgi:XamI restriction endonuclease
MKSMALIPPPRWTLDELQASLKAAKKLFQRERLEEPLEAYLEAFETIQDTVENLMEGTVDLSLLEVQLIDLLKIPSMLDAIRYLAGPPISNDDLKVLVDATSLSPGYLERNPEILASLRQVIRDALDRRRFPWVSEGREPTPTEREVAIISSTALMATQRAATNRRHLGKRTQEESVRRILLNYGFEEIQIPSGKINTMNQGPKPGQFCNEVLLGDRKADLVLGLWDTRLMPIECKVSNSSTNSVKRLNNDAAAKAEAWIQDFGRVSVVPAAVLSGVYKVRNLESAQNRGLTLFWAHNLTALTEWMDKLRGVNTKS